MKRASLCFVVYSLLTPSAFAAVIRVPADYPTIQMAITAAAKGDEVVVSTGTYHETLSIARDIVFRSGDPTNPAVVARTILTSGPGAGAPGITLYGVTTNCIISGLTISNFNLYGGISGAAIYGNGSGATIQFCRIVDNKAYTYPNSYGGGISFIVNGVIQFNNISGNQAEDTGYGVSNGGGLFDCSGVIRNNIIAGNAVHGYGGGLSRCAGLIEGNIIYGNSADGEGGGLDGCTGTIQNNLIYNNHASAGGGLSLCSGVIRNNTIVGNSASFGGGVSQCASVLTNCIIWANTASQSEPQLRACPYPAYSCIQDWTGFGVGNISGEPKFLNVGNPAGVDGVFGTADDGFHLVVGSPCVDKGTSLSAPARDITGITRPKGAGIDMGAYEGSAPYVNAGSNLTVILPAVAVLKGSAISSNVLVTTWSKVSGSGTVTFGNPNSTNTTATFSMAGVYVLRLTASDGVLSASSDATVNAIQCTFSISPTGRAHGAGAESGTVSVTAGVGCTWAATSNDGWVSVTSGYSGTGNGTAGYALQVNNTGSTRTGTVTVAGQTFTLTQMACTYALSSTFASYGAKGGSSNLTITTTSGCPWSANANDGWITITSASSGAGNSVVTFTVSPNPNLSGRDGTMTIAGQAFAISQTGNTAPQVSIAAVPPVILPVVTANLDATATDDGAPSGTINVTWSKVSGAGTVSFGNANAIDTTATFSTTGAYVLRLTASDGALSASNDVAVIVDTPPTITSPPAVTNQFATVGGSPVVQPGDSVAFSISATDADGNPLSCLWDFGDGQTGFDCAPSHVFSNCGPHEVTAIVSDGIVSATNNVIVSVICPFAELPKAASLKMKSNFAPGKLDTATFKASLDLPVGFSVTNTPVSLEVAGTSVSFTLNAKGQGLNTFSKIKLTHKGKGTSTVWQVSANLKGDWDVGWQNYGLTNATVTATNIAVPVLLLFDSAAPESFFIDKTLLYKAKAGKSGTAK